MQAIIEKYKKDEIATGYRLEQPVWRGDRLPAIVLRSIEGRRAPDEDIYSALSPPDCAHTTPLPLPSALALASLDLAVLRNYNRDVLPLGLFQRRTRFAYAL